MTIFFIFFSILVLIYGCESMNDKAGLKDDNMLEEAMESVLEKNTGIDLDFSPRSPE